MSIPLNDQLQVLAARSVDGRYGKISFGKTVPFDSLAEANSLIPSAYRFVGLEIPVMISGEVVKHWYQGGIADNNLIPFEEYYFSATFSGDGKTSETAVDIVPSAVKASLETLEGDERLSASAIKDLATGLEIDPTVIDGSPNAVSGNAVFDFVETKFDDEAVYFGSTFTGSGTFVDPFNTTLVKQVHASGSSVTVATTTTWLLIDGGSTFATVTVTLPATPTDLQTVEISTDDAVTSFSVVANSGHTLVQASVPSTLVAGEIVGYRFTNNKWYRVK